MPRISTKPCPATRIPSGACRSPTRVTTAWPGRPTNALLHAVLRLRALPKAQRQAWKALFDHYVFDHDGAPAHLPEQAQGPLASPMTEQAARLLRAELMAKFKR